MQNVTGLTGAAPIWAEYMRAAVQPVTGGNPSAFSRPPGVIERVICAISGTEPSGDCPSQRTELFAADQPPLPASQDLWKKVVIDTWTGLEASPACDEFTDEEKAINVTDPWAVRWIQRCRAVMGRQTDFKPVFFVPQRQCGRRITRAPVHLAAQGCHHQLPAGDLRPGRRDWRLRLL
jgi:hypothetical protein